MENLIRDTDVQHIQRTYLRVNETPRFWPM